MAVNALENTITKGSQIFARKDQKKESSCEKMFFAFIRTTRQPTLAQCDFFLFPKQLMDED